MYHIDGYFSTTPLVDNLFYSKIVLKLAAFKMFIEHGEGAWDKDTSSA